MYNIIYLILLLLSFNIAYSSQEVEEKNDKRKNIDFNNSETIYDEEKARLNSLGFTPISGEQTKTLSEIINKLCDELTTYKIFLNGYHNIFKNDDEDSKKYAITFVKSMFFIKI